MGSKFSTIYYGILFLFALNSESRGQSPFSNNKIKTEIFRLNLCEPTENNTFSGTFRRGRFEVNWKRALTFELTNTNHFKYDYKINSVPFAYFVDTSYAGFTNSINSSIDTKPDPFLKFEVESKSPIKTQYLYLDSSIKALYKHADATYDQMLKIQMQYDFKYPYVIERLPEKFKKKAPSKTVTEYTKFFYQYSDTYDDITNLQNSLNTILSFSGQKNSLLLIAKNIGTVENFLNNGNQDQYSQIEQLISYINTIPDSFYSKNDNPRNDQSDAIKSMNYLLQGYQQTAQQMRNLLARFEIRYNQIKNQLVGQECYPIQDTITIIQNTINKFLLLRENLHNLENLYTLHPLQNEYLEKYLLAEDAYAKDLVDKYMPLDKVIGIDKIYVTPTAFNMKNFDLITIELEKTNKFNGHTEKYDYDVYIKGGMKVDFSAGLFGTFLTNYQYETIDSLDKDNNATNYKLIRRINNGKVNIGFGGMVNITKRTGASWFAPGICFGLVLSTQPSLQFTSGLTLSMGKTERLLLHAGYALGFVKRVDGLPLDVNIPTIRIGDQVRTIDKFLARPFFGLTYNLSKNNVFKVSSFMTSTGTGSGSSASSDSGKDKK